MAGDWVDSYAEIFQGAGENLQDSQVRSIMIMMHESSEEVAKHSSVNDDMRNTVQYWYEAMTDTNQGHCNVAYLDELYKNLYQLRKPPTPNLASLFGFVFQNLQETCKSGHSDIKEALNRYFNNNDKVDLIRIRKLLRAL